MDTTQRETVIRDFAQARGADLYSPRQWDGDDASAWALVLRERPQHVVTIHTDDVEPNGFFTAFLYAGAEPIRSAEVARIVVEHAQDEPLASEHGEPDAAVDALLAHEFVCEWCDAATTDLTLVPEHMAQHCPVCGEADGCEQHADVPMSAMQAVAEKFAAPVEYGDFVDIPLTEYPEGAFVRVSAEDDGSRLYWGGIYPNPDADRWLEGTDFVRASLKTLADYVSAGRTVDHS